MVARTIDGGPGCHDTGSDVRRRDADNFLRLALLNNPATAVPKAFVPVKAPPVNLVDLQAPLQSHSSFTEAIIDKLLDGQFGVHRVEFGAPRQERQGIDSLTCAAKSPSA